MKNITPRMFRRTLTTLALTSMLASLTACTGTTTAMDTAIRQPQVTATARTDTNLPDHIVNGGFDYPDMSMLGARDSLFVYISRKDLSYARKDTQDKTNPADPPRFALPSGFDASGFAWHSTQGNTGLANEKPDDVQVWTVYDGGNHYAELAAALALLPEQTQEEIFRYYFLRQPQRVIGVHIGRTRSTAGRHIRLALQRLRRLMEGNDYE